MIKMNPINENVLIRVLEEEHEGGILVPDSHQKSKFGA